RGGQSHRQDTVLTTPAASKITIRFLLSSPHPESFLADSFILSQTLSSFLRTHGKTRDAAIAPPTVTRHGSPRCAAGVN
ncbi:MAG TPA: hypothetical protein VGJ20_11150, partial [Xanthobacteraceae bacterium]